MIPVSSVPCEHGFSIQNRVKTKMRSRLTDTHVDNLMLIAMEAPDLQSRLTDADGIIQRACEDFAHSRGRQKLH